MKKFLILLSVVLTFATTGLFAQAITEPTTTSTNSEQSVAPAKHGKHHQKKHRKHARKGHKKHHGKKHPQPTLAIPATAPVAPQ